MPPTLADPEVRRRAAQILQDQDADASAESDGSGGGTRPELRGRTYEEQRQLLQPAQTGGETTSDAGWGTVDSVQLGLDGLGLVPAFGNVADAVNALISLVRGNYLDAGLSATAMVPLLGQFAGAGKIGGRTANAVSSATRHADEVIPAATRHLDEASAATRVTLPRPKGIPETWIAKRTKRGGGTRYHAPDNPHHQVRVMPGNPNSPYANSRRPYVRHTQNGKSFDARGKLVDEHSAAAHIPLEDFRWPF